MRGTIYIHPKTGELYICTNVEGRFYLICLSDGRFWEDCDTTDELEKILSEGGFWLFTGKVTIKDGRVNG